MNLLRRFTFPKLLERDYISARETPYYLVGNKYYEHIRIDNAR